jgi:arylsulfatase A-like enzyme
VPGTEALLPRARSLASEVGGVLLAWFVLLALEHLAVGLVERDEFSASWEMGLARRFATPIALGALLPCAVVAVGLGRLAARARREGRARADVAALLGLLAGGLAYGVSFGRHMAHWSVRAPFIAVFAVGAATLGWATVPRVVDFVHGHPRKAALLGAAASVVFWTADALVLPRLYPAFHVALFVLLLAAGAVAAGACLSRARSRVAEPLGAVLVFAAVCSLVGSPFAARRLRAADNLRLILTEHAPILGRAIRVATMLAPPLPDDGEPLASTLTFAPGEIPRALDWNGHDILLLSVDALRADHVSAYGYERPTTPNIDALAREGALFDSAYCPTPHTSYSVTSMMAGKAMRPLLSLGLGADSETWAAALRRYGFRTAGFYPPAVFYIDEERFRGFESRGFDFEYRKVEFAPAAGRVDQLRAYLTDAPKDPVFVWVHFFEPHEPYEMHASHPFGAPSGARAVDAYDSEIAEADDAVGSIVRLFREKRGAPVILLTADHGEEFGEHGGHYHGTTCYEEQVHVPLVVVGPGVVPRRVHTVVQTIDLLPTALSALGIPRPARIRGRDLGPVLADRPGASDAGTAYAETDDYTLLARGDDRLVCARKLGACTLYDLTHDPTEHHDTGGDAAEKLAELRRLTRTIEREEGQFEGQGSAEWPEALRLGLEGEADAAEDVATLLDDAKVTIRRKAAEVLYRLRASGVSAQARRALGRDEDEQVRRWCALALVRMGEEAPPLAAALTRDPSLEWRRRAALAFAGRGDARGASELSAWWKDEAPPREGLDVQTAKELLEAMARVHDVSAVPGLIDSLEYVPLRPWIADALGAIGDLRARRPLLSALVGEQHVGARSHEARALITLGARAELRPPLARFAGMPEPMADAVAIAHEAGILEASTGGISFDAPTPDVVTTLSVPVGVPLRLLALAANDVGPLSGTAGGRDVEQGSRVGSVRLVELDATANPRFPIRLHDPGGLLAVWIVPHAAELPLPPPKPFEGGRHDPSRPEHHS